MPIWVAVTTSILFGIAILAFCRAFYFQAKVILKFPMRKMADYYRFQKGVGSDRELKLRNSWLRALLHSVATIGVVILWAIGISVAGLNGPLNCTLNESDSAYFVNSALKGIVCPPNL